MENIEIFCQKIFSWCSWVDLDFFMARSFAFRANMLEEFMELVENSGAKGNNYS